MHSLGVCDILCTRTVASARLERQLTLRSAVGLNVPGPLAAAVRVLSMATVGVEIATAQEAAPTLLALRALPWDVRARVLLTLREADVRLWLRCCAELGPDEVLFTAMVVAEVEDYSGPIPLPDGPPRLLRRRLSRKSRPLP